MFDSHNIDDFTDVQVSVAGNYYHGKHKRNRMKGQNKQQLLFVILGRRNLVL